MTPRPWDTSSKLLDLQMISSIHATSGVDHILVERQLKVHFLAEKVAVTAFLILSSGSYLDIHLLCS